MQTNETNVHPQRRWSDVSDSQGYDTKTGLVLLLGRVEAKLDSALLWLQRHEEKVNELDKRVDALERNRAYIIGIVLAISVGITSVGAVLNPQDFVKITPATLPDRQGSSKPHQETPNVTEQ